ncbi:ABC transporter [Petrotoga sp. HKA.pet.4.5]|uniref:ribosomal protection-like ABC-F family protein n=1 Tax=Petrotoga sp. Shatin.DS.tank11.9.2.9.3 TaxID=1469556 RepID=UPI000EF1566A|nr:ABC transporter [Petrotoga sp. Shatin.DS.tank11.9.2.9.3]RLL90213.1 ABC transporter [Petrotoga sp. HKA.pet.4.5]
MLLRLENVSHNFGEFYLFYDVDLVINQNDRIALIGKNGAGKTTLLNIISGNIEPIEGRVLKRNDLNISLLKQYRLDLNKTDPTLYDFIKESVSKNTPEHIVDKTVRSLLVGLGFEESQWNRNVSGLSGGELTRLSLGKTLSEKSDLLLLDEPTNHLDLFSIDWLINYLKNYKGAMVIVSHDRTFLKQLCNKYWEINNSKIWEFKGTYKEYIQSREIYINSVNSRKQNLQKEIERLEKMIERYRSWATEKMVRQAVIRERKLEELKNELEEIQNIEEEKGIDVKIPQPTKTGYKVVEVKDLSFSYNKEQKLLENISFELYEGEKLAILGKNGCGKSTLLKLLIGELENHEGSIEWGYNIKIGYLDQVISNLSQEYDVLNETWELVKDWKDFEVRKYLGRFGFYSSEVFKKVSELSGGELTRLALAKILLEKPNVLILDEPTNHLDILTIESLEQALKEYTGAIIFVSHDQSFIENISNKFLLIDNGESKISENIEPLLEEIKNNSFKIKKEKKVNEEYEQNKKIKNRIKTLNKEISRIRVESELLFEKLDSVEAKLFEYGDDYNKVLELIEEKNKLEKELTKLQKLESKYVEELNQHTQISNNNYGG